MATAPASVTARALEIVPVSATDPALETDPVSVTARALEIAPVSETDPELETGPISVTAPALEIVPASVTVRESETARQHFPAYRDTNQETVPELDLQSPAGRQRFVLRAFGHPEYAHRVFDHP